MPSRLRERESCGGLRDSHWRLSYDRGENAARVHRWRFAQLKGGGGRRFIPLAVDGDTALKTIAAVVGRQSCLK